MKLQKQVAFEQDGRVVNDLSEFVVGYIVKEFAALRDALKEEFAEIARKLSDELKSSQTYLKFSVICHSLWVA
jgi:hypothetical protein